MHINRVEVSPVTLARFLSLLPLLLAPWRLLGSNSSMGRLLFNMSCLLFTAFLASKVRCTDSLALAAASTLSAAVQLIPEFYHSLFFSRRGRSLAVSLAVKLVLDKLVSQCGNPLSIRPKRGGLNIGWSSLTHRLCFIFSQYNSATTSLPPQSHGTLTVM